MLASINPPTVPADPSRFALFDLGFRPFYLLAGAYAALAVPLWAMQYAGWLPGADLKTGEEVAERVRTTIESSPFRHSGQELRITVSVGVASYPNPIRSVENLMGAADTALYTAKRGGRNKVVASRAQAG